VYQTKILQAGGLEAIHDLLIVPTNHGDDTVIAAVAALKNISIHQGSEVSAGTNFTHHIFAKHTVNNSKHLMAIGYSL